MLTLTSIPGNVSEVEPFVEKLVDRFRINPDKQCNILVSLTEAVTNAIVHGNCKDESKIVQIKLKKQNDCLALRVSDEGQGFDHRNLPDPTAPENIVKTGGRGVFLMKQLSDDLAFYNNGSTVEIQFKL